MEAGETSLGGLELRACGILCRVAAGSKCMKLAVELVSIAGVCECTTVHYADGCGRKTEYADKE